MGMESFNAQTPINTSEKETDKSENKEEIKSQEMPEGVQNIINKMKAKGFYENELPNLKSGEMPPRDLASRMIASVFASPSIFKPEDATVLMENLPYDSEYVKDRVTEDIIEDLYVDENSLKQMEIAGIDPSSLHDKAVEQLGRFIYLIAGDEQRQVRTPENLQKWRETFGISDEEYSDALYKFWSSHNGNISNKYLLELGFVKNEGGNTRWAWESKKE